MTYRLWLLEININDPVFWRLEICLEGEQSSFICNVLRKTNKKIGKKITKSHNVKMDKMQNKVSLKRKTRFPRLQITVARNE